MPGSRSSILCKQVVLTLPVDFQQYHKSFLFSFMEQLSDLSFKFQSNHLDDGELQGLVTWLKWRNLLKGACISAQKEDSVWQPVTGKSRLKNSAKKVIETNKKDSRFAAIVNQMPSKSAQKLIDTFNLMRNDELYPMTSYIALYSNGDKIGEFQELFNIANRNELNGLNEEHFLGDFLNDLQDAGYNLDELEIKEVFVRVKPDEYGEQKSEVVKVDSCISPAFDNAISQTLACKLRELSVSIEAQQAEEQRLLIALDDICSNIARVESEQVELKSAINNYQPQLILDFLMVVFGLTTWFGFKTYAQEYAEKQSLSSANQAWLGNAAVSLLNEAQLALTQCTESISYLQASYNTITVKSQLVLERINQPTMVGLDVQSSFEETKEQTKEEIKPKVSIELLNPNETNIIDSSKTESNVPVKAIVDEPPSRPVLSFLNGITKPANLKTVSEQPPSLGTKPHANPFAISKQRNALKPPHFYFYIKGDVLDATAHGVIESFNNYFGTSLKGLSAVLMDGHITLPVTEEMISGFSINDEERNFSKWCESQRSRFRKTSVVLTLDKTGQNEPAEEKQSSGQDKQHQLMKRMKGGAAQSDSDSDSDSDFSDTDESYHDKNPSASSKRIEVKVEDQFSLKVLDALQYPRNHLKSSRTAAKNTTAVPKKPRVITTAINTPTEMTISIPVATTDDKSVHFDNLIQTLKAYQIEIANCTIDNKSAPGYKKVTFTPSSSIDISMFLKALSERNFPNTAMVRPYTPFGKIYDGFRQEQQQQPVVQPSVMPLRTTIAEPKEFLKIEMASVQDHEHMVGFFNEQGVEFQFNENSFYFDKANANRVLSSLSQHFVDEVSSKKLNKPSLSYRISLVTGDIEQEQYRSLMDIDRAIKLAEIAEEKQRKQQGHDDSKGYNTALLSRANVHQKLRQLQQAENAVQSDNDDDWNGVYDDTHSSSTSNQPSHEITLADLLDRMRNLEAELSAYHKKNKVTIKLSGSSSATQENNSDSNQPIRSSNNHGLTLFSRSENSSITPTIPYHPAITAYFNNLNKLKTAGEEIILPGILIGINLGFLLRTGINKKHFCDGVAQQLPEELLPTLCSGSETDYAKSGLYFEQSLIDSFKAYLNEKPSAQSASSSSHSNSL